MRAQRHQHVLGVRAPRITDDKASALLLLLRAEPLDQPRQGARVTDPGQCPPGDVPDRSVEVQVGRFVLEQVGEPVGVRRGRRAQHREDVRRPQPHGAVRIGQQPAREWQQGGLHGTPLGEEPPCHVQCLPAQRGVPGALRRLDQPHGEGELCLGVVPEQPGRRSDQILSGPGNLDVRGVPDAFEAWSQSEVREHLDQPVHLPDRQFPVQFRRGVNGRDPQHRVIAVQQGRQHRSRIVGMLPGFPGLPGSSGLPEGEQQRQTYRRVRLGPPPLQQECDPDGQGRRRPSHRRLRVREQGPCPGPVLARQGRRVHRRQEFDEVDPRACGRVGGERDDERQGNRRRGRRFAPVFTITSSSARHRPSSSGNSVVLSPRFPDASRDTFRSAGRGLGEGAGIGRISSSGFGFVDHRPLASR